MATGKKVLIGCLVAAAGFFLLIVLLLVAYVIWGMHANDRAKAQARAFCQATKPGEDVARVIERAKGPNPPNSYGDDGEGVYHFYWAGMIYNAMDCEVTTKDGRVVTTKVVEDVD